MRKIGLAIFILTTFYLILNTSLVLAQSKILINEFLIDPQPQSVEIFNFGTESADISDWIIDDSGGTTFFTIPKDSIIFPNQCLVFSADFNLNKSSADTVKLTNNSVMLDSFSYKSSSGSGISYLRLPDGGDTWTTGSANLGLYNQTNVSCLITPTPIQPTLTDSTDLINPPTPTIVPSPTISDLTPSPYSLIPISYNNIYLSEVMANPPTGEKEWIEIYNDNDFPVYLNNWYIDDLENAGSTLKIFSVEINTKSYTVYNLTSSIFNNDGDSVRLLDFNKNLKDDFEYRKSEKGKTLGRTSFESDDFCLQEPSKDSANNPCINPIPTIVSSVLTKQINLSPTINNISSNMPITKVKANSFDVSIHRSINYPTGAIIKNFDNGDVLGITSTTTNSNLLLIRCLTFVSFSYSLLTIISILFRMKLSYGKDKNFYSPFVRSS
ncbi:MAG: lamin tail domain-containing protein [Patescibacteria group bacterium]